MSAPLTDYALREQMIDAVQDLVGIGFCVAAVGVLVVATDRWDLGAILTIALLGRVVVTTMRLIRLHRQRR